MYSTLCFVMKKKSSDLTVVIFICNVYWRHMLKVLTLIIATVKSVSHVDGIPPFSFWNAAALS